MLAASPPNRRLFRSVAINTRKKIGTIFSDTVVDNCLSSAESLKILQVSRVMHYNLAVVVKTLFLAHLLADNDDD